MTKFSIFILFTVFCSLKAQENFTKEEIEVYNNWKKSHGSPTPIFRQSPNSESEMKAVINDQRKIKKHNEKFRSGERTFSAKLWKRSNANEKQRRFMTRGFSLGDVLKRTQNVTSTQGIILQNNPTIAKITSFLVAPESLDWRDYGVIGPVQDQGIKCSSCWAFTAIGALEAAYAIATGNQVKLSEQQLLDCNYNFRTGNWGCFVRFLNFLQMSLNILMIQGGWMTAAYAYGVLSGITMSSNYPYVESRARCRFNSSFPKVELSSFVTLPTPDEEILKKTLAAVGPIGVSKKIID